MSYGAVPPPQTLFSGRGGPATSSTVSTKAQKQKNEDEVVKGLIAYPVMPIIYPNSVQSTGLCGMAQRDQW